MLTSATVSCSSQSGSDLASDLAAVHGEKTTSSDFSEDFRSSEPVAEPVVGRRVGNALGGGGGVLAFAVNLGRPLVGSLPGSSLGPEVDATSSALTKTTGTRAPAPSGAGVGAGSESGSAARAATSPSAVPGTTSEGSTPGGVQWSSQRLEGCHALRFSESESESMCAARPSVSTWRKTKYVAAALPKSLSGKEGGGRARTARTLSLRLEPKWLRTNES